MLYFKRHLREATKKAICWSFVKSEGEAQSHGFQKVKSSKVIVYILDKM